MIRMKFKTILTLLLCVCNFIIHAQNTNITPNLKFGNPTKQEMDMTVCPFDSSAKAVVLCDLTDISYAFEGNAFKTKYNIKRRIKILHAEGTEAANISLVYYSPEGGVGKREQIRGIKAIAYNMVGGKMVGTKMENKLIFEKRIDKYRMQTKFTVPQAKAGTVIEYQYVKSSDYFYQIDDWYAQSDFPIVYTQLDVEIPDYLVFNVEQTGANFLQVTQKGGTRAYAAGDEAEQTTCYTFKGHNLPAIKGDKFVWCPTMYANKISFELRSINVPGVFYKNFTTSWEDIDKLLMEESDFGDCIKRANPLKDEMRKACIDTISDFKRKVIATYLLLKKNVKWDKSYALFGTTSHKVLKEGQASNADINFLLMNMLQSLDIKTVPMVLRTREQGILPLTHPSLESLNTFVVGIYENDSTLHVMDGSSERGYLDVLPPVLLTTAHVVNGGTFDLMKMASAKKLNVVKATLKSDGTLEGRIENTYYGISSLMKKKNFLAATDSATYVKDEAKSLDITVNRYRMTGEDKYSPSCKEVMEFAKNMSGGDVIYLRPVLCFPFAEAPFTAEERQMPVEFDSPMLTSYNSIILIPKDYVVEDIPAPKFLHSPDGVLSFRTKSWMNEGYLYTTYNFQVKKTLFAQDEYKGLKAFFEDVYHALQSVVVLKKK